MNKYRGESKHAQVKLGTSTFALKYDMNALAEIEQALGHPVSEYLDSDNGRPVGPAFIRAALWAGLLHDTRINKGLTIKKVGKLMRAEDFGQYSKAIVRGIMAALGADETAMDEALDAEEAAAADPLAQVSLSSTETEKPQQLAPSPASPALSIG